MALIYLNITFTIKKYIMMDDDYISPDRNHSALLIIDVQRDFTLMGATSEVPGTLQAIPYMQCLVQSYRGLRLPIVHVIRLYCRDGSNVDLCRRHSIENGKQVVIPGSDGAEIMDELKPSSTNIRLDPNLLLSGHLQQIGSMEWIMYKPRWGAFYNTVVVCGCNFPNCPRTTIYEASERDFKIVLAKDATSLIYDLGLQELRNIGASVMNTEECIAWLGASKVQGDQP
jgi:nicotinamidase-related amidase